MADEYTLKNLFRAYYPQYLKRHRVPLKQHRAAEAIQQCRTPAMGGHTQFCPSGHHQHTQYHSCQHRSCPACSEYPRAKWVAAQSERLLPCDHFHVIFTLPHELLVLWQYNTEWFMDLMFTASRETVIDLMEDPKHLGATPGVLSALHTWGRNLSRHPHIHALVSAGGLDKTQQWRDIEGDFLLPIRVVKPLYRGKILGALTGAWKAGELKVPDDVTERDFFLLIRALYKKEWSVRIQSRYRHGRGVMLYLSRYLRGGPLHPRQIRSATHKEIVFGYKDHRDGKQKVLRLRPADFLRRLLWHVPESKKHTVRHFGLYGHAAKSKRNRARQGLGAAPEVINKPLSWGEWLKEAAGSSAGGCPVCGQALLAGIPWGRRRDGKQNTYINGVTRNHVQQDDQADASGLSPPARERDSRGLSCGSFFGLTRRLS